LPQPPPQPPPQLPPQPPQPQQVARRRHSSRGLEWDRQSCWLDASLMSLFYPDSMHAVLLPMIQNAVPSSSADIESARTTLLQVIAEMRDPAGAPQLHGLRAILAKCAITSEQKDAFQVEDRFGYVFYFVQELLKLFDAPCTRAIPPGKTYYKRLYVMEMKECAATSIEACLESSYRDWQFEEGTLAKYMVIELIDEDGHYAVKPQERITFRGFQWTLTSMVVFDCNHFVSYINDGTKWLLYDDTRSLSHKELAPYEFGTFYNTGSCKYQYGKNNTFFFYTR
jgi:hypothetical protein